MRIIKLNEIKTLLSTLDLTPLIEAGFVAYSKGLAIVPPVGELQLPKGEVHIKYGAINTQPFYVIKIATGFFGNADLGLPTGNGCMLVFNQDTGELECILLDEGHLTNERTAAAGAIAAKYLAPKSVSKIGIVGTGVQARAQLRHLRPIVDCTDVMVWGRTQDKLDRYAEDLGSKSDADYQIETTLDIEKIQSGCNLIVTTTPATLPLLLAKHLKPGTHITAVGSDTLEKQELDAEILHRADVVVADSIEQCKLRGEICRALGQDQLQPSQITELGHVIDGTSPGRTSDNQITVADLTGVAVQDIQIASAVFAASAQE